jgi:hypothetical protein
MQINPYPSDIETQLTTYAFHLAQEVERVHQSTHTSFSCALSWLTGRAWIANSGRTIAGFLFGLACLLVLIGCGTTSQQRILYEASGIQIGIMTDLSTNDDGSSPVRNRHPADLTPREIRSLIGSLEVSGWSGTILGLLTAPQPKPLFTEAERAELAEPLAAAFHAATPRERVFFAIQNPDAPYDTDRTSGSLFFRDDYLHVVLTDHYAFLQADPGGGEKRDPRDTKGMKLWLIRSAPAATVPEKKEPRWNAFEKVHISFVPAEVLAGQRVPQTTTGSSRPQVTTPVVPQPSLNADTAATSAPESLNNLRLQLRELTKDNLDLRSQLKDQSDTIEKLKAEFEGIRNEKKLGPVRPSSESKSSRKQATP